jgi:hypothetical protein
VLLAPFGLLPQIPATLLWGFLLLAAYLVSGCLLIHTLGWNVLPGLGLYAVGSVLWQPAVQAIQWLNMDQVLLLLLVGVWLLERRGQNTWAGVLLGVASLLKMWPLLFLVIPVLQRHWRLVAATGSVVLDILYLPLLPLLLDHLLQLIWNNQAVLGLLGAVEQASPTLGLLLFACALAYLLASRSYRQPTVAELDSQPSSCSSGSATATQRAAPGVPGFCRIQATPVKVSYRTNVSPEATT